MEMTCTIYKATRTVGVRYEHGILCVSDDARETLKELLARPTLIDGFPRSAKHVTQLLPCRISIWRQEILGRITHGFSTACTMYEFEVHGINRVEDWPEFWDVVTAINVGRAHVGKEAKQNYYDALEIGKQTGLL